MANQWENPRNMIEKVPNLPRQQIAEEEDPESDEEAPHVLSEDVQVGLGWIVIGIRMNTT